MDLIEISKSKITALIRKVEINNLDRQLTNKCIVLNVTIHMFDAIEKEVITAEVKPYIVSLMATNNNFIDPSNGNYVDDKFAGSIGEFDFINALGAQPIKQNDLILQYIKRADILGKFDL